MVDVTWVNDKFSSMVHEDLVCLDQPYSKVIAPPTEYVPKRGDQTVKKVQKNSYLHT